MKTTCRNRCRRRRPLNVIRGISLLTASLFVAGCPSGPQSASTGKISVKGSNTIGEELGPRLIAEYQKDHPGISISLESKGTGSGISNLIAGACDIASASRVVSQEELLKAQAAGIDFSVHTIGHYSVAVIANDHNSVKNLSRDQVRDIFTGDIHNWKEVGGPDAPIHIYVRAAVSGTYLGFRELAMEDKPYASQVQTFTNYSALAEAVARDPNAIGYASIELTTHSGVKPVAIRGISPDAVSVNEARYPYSRVLRFYTNKTNETAQVREFIQFVQSPRGQSILEQMGFVPRL
jgi:phosphate transport system substrate-binding protein